MRTTKRLRTVLALLALVALTASPAWAGDEETGPAGDTPAEKAYAKAWWAETSTGALDEALERYDEVVGLEGPKRVKALALYRKAVVLERMGRTDEAIRTLEALAQAHPDEQALQQKARARLEEWTAVDLRTSFGEWYRRYQYSPEFQAKIVDIVRRLGLSDVLPGRGTPAEEKELLTIGEATVPALRAHLDSPNERLRAWCTVLLLQLGDLPPLAALLDSNAWTHRVDAWRTLFELPEETRARLRAEFDGQTAPPAHADALRAALDGPSAALDALRADGIREWTTSFLKVLASRPGGEPMVGHLLQVAADADTPASAGSLLARELERIGLVDDDTWLAWIRGAPSQVQGRAASVVQRGNVRHPDAWKALAHAMLAASAEDQGAQRYFGNALARAVGFARPDADLTPAVRAVERAWPRARFPLPRGPYGEGMGLGSGQRLPEDEFPAFRRWLAMLVDTTRVEHLGRDALRAWASLTASRTEKVEAMLRWAAAAAERDAREDAAKVAGTLADADTLDALIDLLPALEPRVATALIYGLRSHKSLHALPWTDARLARLLDVTKDLAGKADLASRIEDLYEALLRPAARLDRALELILADPSRGGRWVYGELGDELEGDPARLGRLREGVAARWDGWTAAQRLAALRGGVPLVWTSLDPAGDELVDRLRAWLRADASVRREEDAPVRRRLAVRLPGTAPADLAAAWDLDDPTDVATIPFKFVYVPKTTPFYDALAALRRHPDASVREAYFHGWSTGQSTAMERRVGRERLEDPDAGIRRRGVLGLGAIRSAEDLPLLVRALEDPDARVRQTAATTMAKVFDRHAIQALVKALDDPHPDVRDAALASLEAIKKIEEQKDYWREFAERDD